MATLWKLAQQSSIGAVTGKTGCTQGQGMTSWQRKRWSERGNKAFVSFRK